MGGHGSDMCLLNKHDVARVLNKFASGEELDVNWEKLNYSLRNPDLGLKERVESSIRVFFRRRQYVRESKEIQHEHQTEIVYSNKHKSYYESKEYVDYRKRMGYETWK